MTVAEFFNKVGFKVNEGDVKKVNNTISDIKKTATKLLGVIGIGFSLTQLNAIAEEFDGIGDRLAYAAGEAENFDEIQKRVLASANAARSAYGDFVGTVTSLKQANADIFPLEEAATFVEYTTKLGKAAGYSDGEISTMQNSLQRIVANGTAGAADITRIIRTTPALAEQLAKALGTDTKGLVKLAEQGKITAKTLKEAMTASANDIDAAYANLNFGVGDAVLQIRNKFGVWIDEMNKTLDLTNTIGKAMVSGFDKVMGVLNKVRNGIVWLSEKLGGADRLLRFIAISAGIMFTAFNFGKITSGLSNIWKMLKNIKLSTLAIIAVAIVIALLVEDFINFMQGNDSVIGSLLEKAGIDTQKVRDTIIGAWNKIKDFLSAAWNAIKDTAKKLWDGLKAFWDKHGESIMSALSAAWNAIKTVLLTVWNIIKTVATTVFDGLRNFWAKHGEQIKKAFSNIWNGIKNVLSVVWNVIKAVAMAVFNALKKFWDTWGNTIMTVFQAVWNNIKAIFSTVFDLLADIFAIFSALFAGDWEGFWENIRKFFSDLWNGLVNIVSTVLDGIWSVISSVFNVIWGFISGIVQKIWDTIVGAFTSVRDTVAGIFGSIKETISNVFNSLVNIVKAPINGIIGFLNQLIDAMNTLSFDIPKWVPVVGGKKFGFDIPHIPALAQGGYLKANNPRLIIAGDNPTEGEIVAPEGKLMAIMTQALNSFIAKLMPTAASGSMTSMTQNRTIVQNIEINNEFNGDTPVQQKASKAMDKASKDVTGELARALQFA